MKYIELIENDKKIDLPRYEHIYITSESESLDNDNQLFSKIREVIENANETVFMSSFLIYGKIVELISRKIKEGVRFYFLLQEPKVMDKNIDGEEESFDNEVKNSYIKFLKTIENVSIVAYSEKIHAKYILVDNNVALISTANFGDTSISKNNEYGIVTQDETIINDLKEINRKLFLDEISELRVAGSGKQSFKEKIDIELKSKIIKTLNNLDGTHEQLIIDFIDNAKKSIKLTTYTLLAQNDVHDALINASKRGINIEIITRSKFINGKKIFKNNTLYGLNQLAEFNNVSIYFTNEMHAKMFIFDEEKAIMTSSNIGNRHYKDSYDIAFELPRNYVNEMVNLFEYWKNISVFRTINEPNNYDKFIISTNDFKNYQKYIDEKRMKLINDAKKLNIHVEYNNEISNTELNNKINKERYRIKKEKQEQEIKKRKKENKRKNKN